MKKSRDEVTDEPICPLEVNAVNHLEGGGQGGTKVKAGEGNEWRASFSGVEPTTPSPLISEESGGIS